MKSTSIMLLIALFIGPLTCQIAGAKDTLSQGRTVTTNAILQDSEIAKMKIQKTMKREWVKTLDAKGMPHSSTGVLQEVETEGIKARVHYADFASAEEAHQAAKFHIKNVASIFQPGIWNGALQNAIGDESWYAQDATTTAILIRSGRTCVLISCRDGDAKKRRQVAEMIGKLIEEKVKSGGQIVLPSEEEKN